MSTQSSSFGHYAVAAVRVVERIPALVWAAWIVGVVLGAGTLAFRVTGPV